jgi:sporulation protein YlmC with PRC-barrel domain
LRYGGIELLERFTKKRENVPKSEIEETFLNETCLINKQVISSKGNIVGKVLDVTPVVGKAGSNLIVETMMGGNAEFAWESIQGAGDYILLKPE